MKLMAEDYVVEFLVSRGLYVLANSAVPVLLAIAVASEGYSASGVGLVLGVGALPGILGALLAPQMLVHVSPKTMFGGAAAAWIVICGGIAMLSRDGSVGLGVYVSVSFSLEFVASIMYPTMGSYVADLVRPDLLDRMNSARAVVTGLCAVAGPGLIALVQSWRGVADAWWLVSLLMLVCLMSQVRLPRGRRTGSSDRVTALRWGLRVAARSRGVLVVLLGSGVWHFTVWGSYMTIYPVVLRDDYRALWFIGVSESLFAVGGIVGSLLPAPSRLSRPILCLVALLSFVPVPVGVVLGAPLWLVAVSVCVSSAVIASTSVAWETFLQSRVERDALPSVFALDYLAGDGIAPLGYVAVPALAMWLGQGTGVLTTAGVCVLVLLGCLWVSAVSPEAEQVEPSVE